MGNMMGNRSESPEQEEPFVEIDDEYNFPKVELHCHLDGSFRIKSVIEIAKQRGIKLVSYDVEELSKYAITTIPDDPSLNKFLDHFQYFAPAFIGSKMAIHRMTVEAIEDCHKRDIVYVELRFCPHLLATAGNEPMMYSDFNDRENMQPELRKTPTCPEEPINPIEVLETVLEAANETMKRIPQIKVRFIMSCIVAFPQWSMELADMCIVYRDKGVVGLDLAGSTDGIPHDQWQMHVDAFDHANKNDINITIHAGEAEGPKSCVKAVDQLHASRIGHGYHIVDDGEVFNRFKRDQYHLECCPRSSYLTGAVKLGVPHPLIRFQKEGINCSVSTDDPGIMITTLLTDYHIVTDEMGLSISDLKDMNIKAAKSAFLPEAERDALVKQLQHAYGQ